MARCQKLVKGKSGSRKCRNDARGNKYCYVHSSNKKRPSRSRSRSRSRSMKGGAIQDDMMARDRLISDFNSNKTRFCSMAANTPQDYKQAQAMANTMEELARRIADLGSRMARGTQDLSNRINQLKQKQMEIQTARQRMGSVDQSKLNQALAEIQRKCDQQRAEIQRRFQADISNQQQQMTRLDADLQRTQAEIAQLERQLATVRGGVTQVQQAAKAIPKAPPLPGTIATKPSVGVVKTTTAMLPAPKPASAVAPAARLATAPRGYGTPQQRQMAAIGTQAAAVRAPRLL